MNAKKTKTMLVSKDLTLTKVSLKMDGDSIKQTNNYTCLGQTITSNVKCDDEILKRIEIARGAFNSMLKTIAARHIRMTTRQIIIKARKENQRRSLVLEMVDEQLYIIPTIKKRKITYFGHVIRRNNIHRLLLEGPLEGKVSRGRPITEWMTTLSQNGRECDTKTS